MTNSTVRTEKPKMELLAPAGGMKHLEAALRFGTDAVTAPQYVTFLLRVLGYSDASGDFAWDDPFPLAEQAGISEGGYRLICNCRADSGQEVPHLHFHLLGGENLGPLLTK